MLKSRPPLFKSVHYGLPLLNTKYLLQTVKPAFTATVVERVPKKTQGEIDLDMEMQSVYGAIAKKNLEGVEPGMVNSLLIPQ